MSEQNICELLIGLTEEAGVQLCNEHNYHVRITEQDGLSFIITMDLRFNRINLHIDNNIITKASIG